MLIPWRVSYGTSINFLMWTMDSKVHMQEKLYEVNQLASVERQQPKGFRPCELYTLVKFEERKTNEMKTHGTIKCLLCKVRNQFHQLVLFSRPSCNFWAARMNLSWIVILVEVLRS